MSLLSQSKCCHCHPISFSKPSAYRRIKDSQAQICLSTESARITLALRKVTFKQYFIWLKSVFQKKIDRKNNKYINKRRPALLNTFPRFYTHGRRPQRRLGWDIYLKTIGRGEGCALLR